MIIKVKKYGTIHNLTGQAEKITDEFEDWIDYSNPIILDYEGVEFVGRSYAKEMLKFFCVEHPFKLNIINCTDDIKRMFKIVAEEMEDKYRGEMYGYDNTRR